MTVGAVIRYIRSSDSRWDGPLETVVHTWLKRLNFVRRYDVRMLTPRLNLQPDDVVADVGCASGYWTAHYAQRCRFATGVDLDPRSIADARRLHRSPNLRFAVGNAEVLPLENSSCDKLISISVFQFVARPDRAFAEVVRVLKPGGTFAFTVDSLDAPWLDESYRQMHCRAFGVRHLYEASELRSLLEGAGLVVDEVRSLVSSRLGSWLLRMTTRLGRLSYLAFPLAYPLLLAAEAAASPASRGHKLLVVAHTPAGQGEGSDAR